MLAPLVCKVDHRNIELLPLAFNASDTCTMHGSLLLKLKNDTLMLRPAGDGRWAGENSGQGSRHSSVGSGALMLHRRLPADAGHAVHVPTSLEIRDQVRHPPST